MKESSFVINWTRAANELGIEFTAPFRLLAGGASYEFDALLPQFGSSNGMLVMLSYQPLLAKAAQDNGYAFSCLSESSDPYEIDNFIDVLHDWGWGRKGVAAPSWYSGSSWSA